MSSHSENEIVAYECGIRLSQAIVLTNIHVPVALSALTAALVRLGRALTKLDSLFPDDDQAIAGLHRLIDECRSIIDGGYNEEFCQVHIKIEMRCRDLLQLISEELKSLLQSLPVRIQNWFNLGMEIVEGDRTQFQSSAGYSWHGTWFISNPEFVELVMERLQLAPEELAPIGYLDESEKFSSIPKFLIYPWTVVEAGLSRLHSSSSTDSEGVISWQQMALLVEKTEKTVRNRLGKDLSEHGRAPYPYHIVRPLLLKAWPRCSHRLPESYTEALRLLRSDRRIQRK